MKKEIIIKIILATLVIAFIIGCASQGDPYIPPGGSC